MSDMRLAVRAQAEGGDRVELWQRIRSLAGRLSLEELQLLGEDCQTDVRLGHVSAPVFNAERTVVMEIAVTGDGGLLGPETLALYADRIRAVCAFITDQIHGAAPVSG